MFEIGKREKSEEETFDLEFELRDPAKYQELKKRVDRRIQELKQILRAGAENKEELERFGALLHAYAALQKLMVRLGEKS